MGGWIEKMSGIKQLQEARIGKRVGIEILGVVDGDRSWELLQVLDGDMLTHISLALVPCPRREARRIPHQQQEKHRPRPRPPTPRLLQGPRQGQNPRNPISCPRTMVQQGGRAKDH
jgi:hypothetical protein